MEGEPFVDIQREDTVPLKRRLGFFSGTSLIIGGIVGSGIFVSPKGVLQNTGSVGLSLVIWCLCGGIAILASLVFAELGTLIPKSGGDFGYLFAGLGRFPAFMFMWSQLLTEPSGQIILGLTVAEYLSKAIFNECVPSFMFKQLVAATVILTAAVTNIISVRFSAVTQILVTTFTLSGLFVIVVGGIVMLSRGSYGSLSTGFDGSNENPASLVSAIYSGMWAFAGWSSLNCAMEEVENPKRNLPLCVITSLLTVTVLYILVNISYLSVLTKEEFLSSWATGVMSLAFVMMIPADLSKMLNLVGFVSWIFDGLIMVVHIILRFKMKHAERPFKVPIICPMIVIIFVLYISVAPFLEPVKTEFWYALTFFLAGAVLYIPFVVFKLQCPGIGVFTKNLQMLMNVAPPSEYRPV